MSLQGIADRAGVSKALVLYHFSDKRSLLSAIISRIGNRSTEEMEKALAAQDIIAAWHTLAEEEARIGQLALLSGLMLEDELAGSDAVQSVRAARESAATKLAASILRGVGLESRVPLPFLGRFVIRHLDGLVVASAGVAVSSDSIADELDAITLALIGLGR